MSSIFSPGAGEFRESVVQPLVKSLDDRDEDVRKSAIDGVTQLMKIGMHTSVLVFNKYTHCVQADLWTKGIMTNDQLAKIIDKLDDSDDTVRRSAIKAVTQLMKIGMNTQFSCSI
jgi:vesicle coat complex subunit